MSGLLQGGITSKTTIVRQREGAGTYVEGVFTAGTSEPDLSLTASVQPPNRMGSDRVIQELVGQRPQDWVCIICKAGTLRALDLSVGARADRVVYNSKTYEVRHLNSWISGQVNMHDTAYAVLIDSPSTDGVADFTDPPPPEEPV
jgi:hypothetical protein